MAIRGNTIDLERRYGFRRAAFSPIALTDVGSYNLRTTNTTAPALTLYSRPINVAVDDVLFQQDSLALVALYNSTSGASWTTKTNWLTGNPLSTWYGVTVSGDRVTQLNLPVNNLTGTIPDSIGNLQGLTQLILRDNQLSGSIQAAIGNLTALTQLDLGENQLSGIIPDTLGNLTSLWQLDLGSNQLSGSIPEVIGSLTSLWWLYLHNNQLTGAIPDTIGNLTNLINLYLGDNQLSGAIPATIGNLTKVERVYITNCQLSGSIPAEIGNLDSLTYLNLYTNQLSGTIPPEIGSLTKLYSLKLFDNLLSGSIPAEMGNMTSLGVLALNLNQLAGAVPTEIGNLPSLAYLFLEGNQLVDLPDLSTVATMVDMKIYNNRFTFEDIEPNIGVPSTTFIYAPQDSVGSEQDTTATLGDSFTLEVVVGGANNLYQWMKDGVDISGATNDTLIISSVVYTDSGSYVLRTTNTIATALTLYSWPINVTVVDLPPAVPTGLSATPSDQQIALTWSPNTEGDFLKYYVYGGTATAPTTLVDSTTGGNLSDTTATITGLPNGTYYYYRITAVDSSGNESAYSSEVSATPMGLVAWYPFNGNANDESANSNNGTVNGATLTTDRFGNVNSAYSFDGVDDQIVVLDNEAAEFPANTSFTVCGWYYGSEGGNNNGLVTKGYEISMSPAENGYLLSIYSGYFDFSVWDPANSIELRSNSNIIDNSWHYYAAVKNADTDSGFVFVDGELVLSDTLFDGDAGVNSNPLVIMNHHSRFTQGIADDIRIYNRALSATEITALYLEGPPQAPTTLAATAANQQINLTWSPNSEADFLKYYVYGGTTPSPTTLVDSTSGGDLNDTTATITGLSNGATYYYRITAVDSAGNESGYSNEDSAIPGDYVAPLAPINIAVLGGNQSAALEWIPNTEPDLALYNIYQSTQSGFTPTAADSIGTGSKTDSLFISENLLNEQTYYFRMAAIDSAGNTSAFSSELTTTPTYGVTNGDFEFNYQYGWIQGGRQQQSTNIVESVEGNDGDSDLEIRVYHSGYTELLLSQIIPITNLNTSLTYKAKMAASDPDTRINYFAEAAVYVNYLSSSGDKLGSIGYARVSPGFSRVNSGTYIAKLVPDNNWNSYSVNFEDDALRLYGIDTSQVSSVEIEIRGYGTYAGGPSAEVIADEFILYPGQDIVVPTPPA